MSTIEHDFMLEEETISDKERMILWQEAGTSQDEETTEDDEVSPRSKYF